MNKTLVRMAIVMAIVCSLPGLRLEAAGSGTEGQSSDVSADSLAQLAAELAEKAQRLEQLEQSLEERQTSQQEQQQGTTFRWVDGNAATPETQTQPAKQDVVAVTTVTDLAPVAPRPAALSYHGGDISAKVGTSKSNVVFAQANEDVFDYEEPQGLSGDLAEGPTAPASQPWDDPLMACGGCCDACCSGCCDSCCGGGCRCPRCCRRPCTIVAGTEAVFLAPDINGRRVNYLFDADPDVSVADPYFYQFGPYWGDAAIDDFYIAPRFWLGVQGCRWGILGRYFHLRAGENDFDRDPGGTYYNQAFNASSVFEAYYTDLLLTRNFCLHGCKNQLLFGARYAAIDFNEQLYGRSVVHPNDHDPNDPASLTGIFEGGARSNRYARGTGLTFGLNGRKPLFCNSCAHWFYSAQSSILWGCNHNDVETRASVLALPTGGGLTSAEAFSINNSAVAVDDDLFIGEFQLGIQWDFALRCLPAKAFFRTAFEYQYWDASTGVAEAGSAAGMRVSDNSVDSDYRVETSAHAPGLIVDLYGVAIATGFTW